MRVFPSAARRGAMAAGCAAAVGLGVVLGAVSPAQAHTSAAATHAGTAGISALSCNYNWQDPATPVKTLARALTTLGTSWGFGYTGAYDLPQRGIVDPPKVTIAGLYNYSNCRIWLGQNPAGKPEGWVYCISPRHDNNAAQVWIPEKYRSAERLLISGNTRACPA
jgi:hypothetical protein